MAATVRSPESGAVFGLGATARLVNTLMWIKETGRQSLETVPRLGIGGGGRKGLPVAGMLGLGKTKPRRSAARPLVCSGSSWRGGASEMTGADRFRSRTQSRETFFLTSFPTTPLSGPEKLRQVRGRPSISSCPQLPFAAPLLAAPY
jgi:hypothetical protein